MLILLRLFRGYLLIEISGENTEKLLNLCAENNLQIWNIHALDKKIIFCISVRSFRKLRLLKRKIKSKVRIRKKWGIPFIINKLKKRYALLLGVAFFFLFLNFMSLFIWNISVTGNKTVSDAEILINCKNMNITAPILKSRIDTVNGPDELVLKNGKLAWASFNIEGCNLTVNVTEISKNKRIDKPPANIIAKADGVIKKVNIKSGDSAVTIGQAVSKGEVLVSGVKAGQNSTVFIFSDGEIFAETEHTFEESADYIKTSFVNIGKKRSASVLYLSDFKIPLYCGKIKNIKVISKEEKPLMFFGKEMPIKLYKLTYKNTEKKKIKLTEKALLKSLFEQIDERVKTQNYIKSEETGSKILKSEKGITLSKTYKCLENIAEIQYIKTDMLN